MKQHFRLSIIATLCSQSFSGFAAEPVSAAQTVMNSADTLAFCQKPTQIDDKDPQAITISAKNATLLKNGEADFSGDVTVCLQDSQLKSDKAQFSRSKRSMSASGQIKYHNEAIDVTSTGLEANIGQSRVKLSNSKYVMTGKVGRGEASLLDIQDKDYLVLNDGTFTTCPIDDDGWLLSAEEITFSRKEGWAEAWNASIRINDTPIIYIPYLTFPLDDRRKSGFLYPKVSSSVKHGVEIITPWYWNISPDLDATLTPRIMTKRGIQLQSEFRYLAQNNEGLVDLELLPQDNERKDLNTRHLVHWQHRSDYDDTLRAFVNFTDVSDDAYLNDLGSKHQDRTDANLNQHFELSYYSHNIDSVLRIQDFKVLGPHPSSYRALPQLAFNNRAPYQYGAFDLNWFGEVSHFASSDADISRANRFHFEPSVSLNYVSPALSLSSELSLLQTNYDQTYQDTSQTRDNSLSRTLPKFRFHSLVNFERPSDWLGKDGLLTFEPQMQYLYIPEKNQDQIGLFDSTRLQDDYYGLFRDNRFSGLDRIADANQITVGATTRFFDQKNNEIFHLSLGQIFYFDKIRTLFTPNDSRINGSKSELAGDIFMRWSKRWDLNANVQYDDDTEKLTKSNVSLNYRGDNFTQAQLNHRYTRSVSGSKIEQVGFMTSIEIAKNWQFVGGYHRDLTNHRSIDSYAGIQYESCCWAIRLVSTRNINTNLEQLTQTTSGFPSSFDSGIALQFVIKGINGSGGFDIGDMLEQGAFGKRRRYFLNN